MGKFGKTGNNGDKVSQSSQHIEIRAERVFRNRVKKSSGTGKKFEIVWKSSFEKIWKY